MTTDTSRNNEPSPLPVAELPYVAPAFEGLLARFLDGLVLPTFLFDDDTRVQYCNRAARLFAHELHPEREESEPERLADWHEALVSRMALNACRKRGSWAGEIKLAAPTGERVVLAQISALGPEWTAPYGMALQDVTLEHRRKLELRERNAQLEIANARLQSAREQVVQTEKLASIGQLAAGVAHEINNPIAYVKSNFNSLRQYTSQILAAAKSYRDAFHRLQESNPGRGIEDPQPAFDVDFVAKDLRELLDESRDGVERVCKIVSDLKDFSRQDHAEGWMLADVHSGLESTLNIAWNEIKYKAEVVRDFNELPMIECLPWELNQVFMNLLVNAAQAIEGFGIITVSTEAAGDTVRIMIGDDGKGIPPDALPRIFDPFFTTKGVGDGTGLGLAISYGIVAKHNGKIEVTSVPGEGSLFMIELPVKQPTGTAQD